MSAAGRVGDALAPIRTGRYAELALLVATVVGVAAAWVHWSGLVLGGALVGLAATSVPRAVVNGVTFGLVVLTVFSLWLLANGALATWAGLGLLFLLSVGIALVLPTLAAIAVRALV